MKILLISTNYYPELTGIGKYSGEMCEWLRNNGHDVRVICSPPYYPEWKIQKAFNKYFYQIERLKNLRIFRCPIWVPKNPSGIKRIIHLLTFAISSLPIVLWQIIWRPHLVICVEPPIVNSISALILAKISRARSILHIQDFEIDAAFDLGILKSNLGKKIIYRIEKLLLSGYDRVSTISEAMLNKLDSKDVRSSKRILFPNWVDINIIRPLPISSYRDDLNIKKEEIVALYSGNIGEKQGLELIIDAAKELQESSIIFIIAGEGAAKKRLINHSKDCINLRWLPIQPYEKLNDFLNMADIHLLPQLPGAADLVMPSKLTGMLSSGRPVIANANKGTQVYNVVNKCGIAVPADDKKAFSGAILDLAEDDYRRLKFGKLARNYAERYLQLSEIMSDFDKTIKELVKN